MNSAIERLLSLSAADVMTPTVVEIPTHLKLPEAASLLKKHRHSGGPVVDEHGRCVGVLSASDFMFREADLAESAAPDRRSGEFHLQQSRPDGVFCIEPMVNEFVTSHMSTVVQTVTSNEPLLDVARCLTGAHVHRVFVLDQTDHVVGVISTLDVLAAVINAVEE